MHTHVFRATFHHHHQPPRLITIIYSLKTLYQIQTKQYSQNMNTESKIFKEIDVHFSGRINSCELPKIQIRKFPKAIFKCITPNYRRSNHLTFVRDIFTEFEQFLTEFRNFSTMFWDFSNILVTATISVNCFAKLLHHIEMYYQRIKSCDNKWRYFAATVVNNGIDCDEYFNCRLDMKIESS